jgi:2-dehydro-3-deoxyphosphooctonate aldolase (KDO 8-P synthase)
MKLCGFEAGLDQPLFLIAGPCVIESEQLVLDTAGELQAICNELGIPFIFKSSFDKANRTSTDSFRGPGLEQGLAILEKVKKQYGVPLLTDVHEDTPLGEVAAVVDVLQTPAFLCRQTNFIQDVARQGLPVNIKKGQFLAPDDARLSVEKVCAAGTGGALLTERGSSFGYNDLVVDMRGLVRMRRFAPVCFDATHSVQHPGAGEEASGGDRSMVAPLARAAVAVGIDALFVEVHPDPDAAPCDGPSQITPAAFEALLGEVRAIERALSR